MNYIFLFIFKGSGYIINKIIFKSIFFVSKIIFKSISLLFKSDKNFHLNYVIDGDTLNMKSPEGIDYNVRLYGIDTPEKYNSNKLDNDVSNGNTFFKKMINKNVTKEEIMEAGNLASSYLKSNMKNGKEYKIKIIGKDKYQRLLAVVYDAQININQELVKNGIAVVKNEFISSPIDLIKYNSLQTKAKKEKSGLWENYENVMNSL